MKKILLTGLLATMSLWAGDREYHHCSTATLHGEYGFSVNGSRPNPKNPAEIEQIIGVALTIFDGQGNLTQTDNIHGSASGYDPSAVDRPGVGTNTLNEDYTGTMTLLNEKAPPLSLRIVVVKDGSEIRTVVVGPLAAMVTSNGAHVHN